MADQSRPLKNVAYDLYFSIFKNDGTVIANPGGLAGRIVCEAHTSGAATDNAPTVVDSTGGICKLTLAQAEMNSDYVSVKVTSTDVGAVAASFTLFPAAAAEPTVAQIADGVWDEAASGHTTAGTFGKTDADQLSVINDLHTDVGTAITNIGDMHATDLPAVKTVVDAVKLKTDNLPASPAAVGSAMTLTAAYDAAKTALAASAYTAPDNAGISDIHTDLGTVDTVVDAIKAKTDNLPSDPADASVLAAAIAALDALLDTLQTTVDGLSDSDLAAISGILDDIKVKTDTIGTLEVTVSSPVAESGDITVYAGDDYSDSDGRELSFAVTAATIPSLTNADVYLISGLVRWQADSCALVGSDWVIDFTPTAAQTRRMRYGRRRYVLQAVLDAGRTLTLASGSMNVVGDVGS